MRPEQEISDEIKKLRALYANEQSKGRKIYFLAGAFGALNWVLEQGPSAKLSLSEAWMLIEGMVDKELGTAGLSS